MILAWLRYRLSRLWTWRHVCTPLDVNFFTGGGSFWCGRCGGTIVVKEVKGERIVLRSTCPVGRALQQYQAERRVRAEVKRAYLEAKKLRRCDHCGRVKLEEAYRMRRCENMCGRKDGDDTCSLLVWS